jgi:hypothetical protein
MDPTFFGICQSHERKFLEFGEIRGGIMVGLYVKRCAGT